MTNLINGSFCIGPPSYDGKSTQVIGLINAIKAMHKKGETFIVLTLDLPELEKPWTDNREHSLVIFFGEKIGYLEALDREFEKCPNYKLIAPLWKPIKALKCRLGGDADEIFYSPITEKYYIKYDFSFRRNKVVVFDVRVIEKIIAGTFTTHQVQQLVA